MIFLLIFRNFLCANIEEDTKRDGHIVEVHFTKDDLNLSIGFEDFEKVDMELYRFDKRFKSPCKFDTLSLSKEILNDKFVSKFLIINDQFWDTNEPVDNYFYVARYNFHLKNNKDAFVRIQDFLRIKKCSDGSIVLSRDFDDINWISKVWEKIIITKSGIPFEALSKHNIGMFINKSKNFSILNERIDASLDKYCLLRDALASLRSILETTRYESSNCCPLMIIEQLKRTSVFTILIEEIKEQLELLECCLRSTNSFENTNESQKAFLKFSVFESASYLMRFFEVEGSSYEHPDFSFFPIFIFKDKKENIVKIKKVRYKSLYLEEEPRGV